MKKKPPVEISQAEKEYLGTLNERERRLFIACKVAGSNGNSIRTESKAFGCSPNTICKGILELFNHVAPLGGKQRMPDGEAKKKINKHPAFYVLIQVIFDIFSRDFKSIR